MRSVVIGLVEPLWVLDSVKHGAPDTPPSVPLRNLLDRGVTERETSENSSKGTLPQAAWAKLPLQTANKETVKQENYHHSK